MLELFNNQSTNNCRYCALRSNNSPVQLHSQRYFTIDLLFLGSFDSFCKTKISCLINFEEKNNGFLIFDHQSCIRNDINAFVYTFAFSFDPCNLIQLMTAPVRP